jgi:hypothetical protein
MLLITLVVYALTHAWYYWAWADMGIGFSDPAFAEQVYRQWSIFRITELGLALGCLAFMIYGGRRRWHPAILILPASIVMVIWLLWFFQPVWTPQR